MLEAIDLSKTFAHGSFFKKQRRVIHKASLKIERGECVGLVGPSGAGKSTLGRLLTRLIEPTSGTLLFRGEDISHAKESKLRNIRHQVQMVFQHPQTSLHPKMKIADLLAEPLRLHRLVEKGKRREAVLEMLRQVGLSQDVLERYPMEVSGGEIQRIVIARVMALKPWLVVLDEPTAMLDPSVQAGILRTLMKLQQSTKSSYLFISHDMRLVRRLCNRVIVMDRGEIASHGFGYNVCQPTPSFRAKLD